MEQGGSPEPLLRLLLKEFLYGQELLAQFALVQTSFLSQVFTECSINCYGGHEDTRLDNTWLQHDSLFLVRR